MEAKVYRYRSASILVVAIFLYIWSIGWTGGMVASALSGKLKVNGRYESVSEAMPLMVFVILFGLFVFGGASRLMLGWIFEQVELRQCEFFWFNWLGRLKLKADQTEIRSVSDWQPYRAMTKTIVNTDRGEAKVFSTVDGYFDLRRRLQSAANGEFMARPEKTQPPLNLSIAPRTYRYRFSYLHLFSFIWTGALLTILFSALTQSTKVGGNPIPFVIFGGGFLCIGIWMQLTGWVERIILTNDGIEWIDWLGRSRVKAHLNEILGTASLAGNRGGALKIETEKGTIHASSYLWGYGDLRSKIESIANAQR